jgi:3-deoxy-D-manno-octulosonic-acid transferase
VRNFADIYARLDAAGAARQVRDVTTLVTAVTDLSRPDRRAPMAYAAWELSSSGADVTDKALALILDHLPGSRAG